jgi:prepilin-type N-terminal cleavage/methylation domain-containing protein/prepilin-type processing-associated H-X9-DG protein
MKPYGFTVTELLVSVAIIGILTAASLPVLKESKNQSMRAKCSSNLRHLGFAYRMFLDENGAFPVQKFETGIYKGWVAAVSPYLHENGAFSQDGIKEIFYCPSNKNPISEAATLNVWTSYAANYHTEDYGPEVDGGGKHQESDVKYPSQFIVLMDMCTESRSRWFGDQGGSPKYKKCFVHSGKANCLFLDNHVEALTPSQISVTNTTVIGSWPDMWYHHDGNNLN